MRERHVGSLVVIDKRSEGRIPAGLLTDCDIVTAVVARDVDLRTLRVGDVMNPEPVTVREQDSLFDALRAMRRHGVLQGVLALDDLVELVAEQMGAIAQALFKGCTQQQKRRP